MLLEKKKDYELILMLMITTNFIYLDRFHYINLVKCFVISIDSCFNISNGLFTIGNMQSTNRKIKYH